MRPTNPESSRGDRAVVIAAILAIVLVGLLGAAPEEPSPSATRTAQSAPR
jgi:hypothetical protein